MAMQHAPHSSLAIIGGGPAGLMAAEVAIEAGVPVDLYDAMGSVGRKFLLAGKGGLNLTHSEPFGRFVARYGLRRDTVARWLADFDADSLRAWTRGLGVETFVGSSGRVFPTDLKAAPLLRAWIRRLRGRGVRFHMHRRWCGWNGNGELRFASHDGERHVQADAVVFALGGASWPRLGSDGAWIDPFAEAGLPIAPLQPANCGFDIGWSEHFATRFAGQPVKPACIAWVDDAGQAQARQGEFVVTATGIEGSLVYALSAGLRERIAREGGTTIHVDLAPGRDPERLARDLGKPRGGRSITEHLRRTAGIEGVKAGLLRECLEKTDFDDPAALAARIKALPLRLLRPRPVDEAISTAGGVRLEALDEHLMWRDRPGVFFAGEMLDWEAPTGGYLLTACFASGRRAGAGAAAWLQRRHHSAVSTA